MHIDGIAYFVDGKRFAKDGLFPNLRTIFVRIENWGILSDPYEFIFPHLMPKTVDALHISFTFRPGPRQPKFCTREYTLDMVLRQTPIRYPSVPHHLKRLRIDGARALQVARLWESLFRVDELLFNGRYLTPGVWKPWGVDVNEAFTMIELGCRGIGWNWQYHTAARPEGFTDSEWEEYELDDEEEAERSKLTERQQLWMERWDDDSDHGDIEGSDNTGEVQTSQELGTFLEDMMSDTESDDRSQMADINHTVDGNPFTTRPLQRRCMSLSQIEVAGRDPRYLIQEKRRHLQRMKSCNILPFQDRIYITA